LTITPLVATGQGVAQEASGHLGVAGDRARHAQPLGHGRGQGGVPLRPATVGQVLAVQVEHVEQERGQGQGGGQPVDLQPAADPAGGDLEGVRPAVGPQSDDLAVEDGRGHRQGEGGRHHLGHPGGDVVQGAGEHGHVVPVPVDLDVDAYAVVIMVDSQCGSIGS
jgi:hypothetical protein